MFGADGLGKLIDTRPLQHRVNGRAVDGSWACVPYSGNPSPNTAKKIPCRLPNPRRFCNSGHQHIGVSKRCRICDVVGKHCPGQAAMIIDNLQVEVYKLL